MSYACCLCKGRDKSLARRIGRLLVKRSKESEMVRAASGQTARFRPSCGGKTKYLVRLMPLHHVTFKEKHRSMARKKIFVRRTSAPTAGSEKFTTPRSHQVLAKEVCGIGVHLAPFSAKYTASSRKVILHTNPWHCHATHVGVVSCWLQM